MSNSTPTATATGLSCRELAFDASGALFISDDADHAILKLEGSGVLNVVAGLPGTAGATGKGGSSTAATLNAPCGLSFAADGSLRVADSLNGVVRRLH